MTLSRQATGTGQFWPHLRRAIPVILGLSLLTFVAERLGFFKGFEWAALDMYFVLSQPREASHVAIVGISDEDYRDLFQERSPLDTDALTALLQAVAQGRPKIIGVDLDTSAKQFEVVPMHFGTPTVWARDARETTTPELFEVRGVLGRRDGDTSVRTGLALLPIDPDGLVRRYGRQFKTRARDGIATWSDTLPWAIVQTYCEGDQSEACRGIHAMPSRASASYEQLLLNFAGDRYRFRRIPASAVLRSAGQQWWRERSPLAGKVALVGGLYRTGRDEYATPIGRMSGVELVAQAVESELDGGGIRDVNFVIMMTMELLIGVALVWLNWRWPPGSRANLMITPPAVVLFAAVGSYAAFWTLSYWANFAPFGIGIWLEQLHHRAKENRQARAELLEYRARFGRLQPAAEPEAEAAEAARATQQDNAQVDNGTGPTAPSAAPATVTTDKKEEDERLPPGDDERL